MNNFSLNKLILLSILCLMAQPLYAAKVFRCWVNEDNINECGDYVPQKYTQKGFTEYDEMGNKIKDVEPAPTAEEIAKREKEERAKREREEQANRDRAFLDIFTSKRDIELARKGVLTSIDGQLQSIETILNGLKRNLADLEESYEKSKVLKASKSQLKTIQDNIDGVKKRIVDTEDTLQKLRADREKTNREYDAHLKRYEEIRNRGRLTE